MWTYYRLKGYKNFSILNNQQTTNINKYSTSWYKISFIYLNVQNSQTGIEGTLA